MMKGLRNGVVAAVVLALMLSPVLGARPARAASGEPSARAAAPAAQTQGAALQNLLELHGQISRSFGLEGEPAPAAAAIQAEAPPPSGPEADAAPAGETPGKPATVSERIVNSSPTREGPRFYPEAMFTLYKKGLPGGPTLLVVGGIQGDEPGGFTAASLVATHYKITKGSVWIVPDLNFPSILQRSRGLHGDMNRKFAALEEKDPEYPAITEIKSILLASEVDLILNMHDGSGFYRHEHIDEKHNPQRWGQCVIIDQERMEAPRFSELGEMAKLACADANKRLLKDEHVYSIRNTHTAAGDKEMEKSLSYFAMRSGKPAFGIEASKEFTTEYRAFYHLLIVESFMRQMGIEFERQFDMNPKGVLAAMNSNLQLAVYKDRLVLPLENVRPALAMVPFRKGAGVEADASRPLLALVEEDKGWRVAYGNRTLTRLTPLYMDFDDTLPDLDIMVDGTLQNVRMGGVIAVDKSFLVKGVSGYRVNAIGALKEKDGTESDVELLKGDFQPRFSVDKDATLYRVEVYKGEAFAGMVLVRFGKGPSGSLGAEPLTAVKGAESEFGY